MATEITKPEKVQEALDILNEGVERGLIVLMKTMAGKPMNKDEEILSLSGTIEKSRRCLYEALGKE